MGRRAGRDSSIVIDEVHHLTIIGMIWVNEPECLNIINMN